MNDLSDLIAPLFAKEDRADAEFRLAILLSEIGDLAKYITHDPALNPNARPHGNQEDEKLAYGQAIVQLAGLALARGIDYSKALEIGLANWQDADWRKRTFSDDQVSGVIGCSGSVSGLAYVVKASSELTSLAREPHSGNILVMKYATPDFVVALEKIVGVVTDQGGATCHAASICREANIPCIVGTGNATDKIQHGASIILDATSEIGKKGWVRGWANY